MTPRESGYRFPAEWEKHEATWLTWPYLESSFFRDVKYIYPSYIEFIKVISQSEKVRINIPDEQNIFRLSRLLEEKNIDPTKIELFMNPSDDVWCRDHGPAFLVNKKAKDKKIIVSWEFNAWGEKYASSNDNEIPDRIASQMRLPVHHPGIVMEGGSVEFNGKGTLLTTKAVLLNQNRNAQHSREDIEKTLRDYYCVDHILWLGSGIEGDDTDGHIDDLTRFISDDTVVTVVEQNKNDVNYQALQDNLKELKSMRLPNGKQLNIIELPMPAPVIANNQRLPASYANFYYTNGAVVMPTYRCKNDDIAISILSDCIKDRKVIGIDSTEIVWGYGSFHCLSQQEPAV